MASLELKGALSVTGGCGPCGASGDQTVRRLGFRCGGFSPYESVAETPAPVRVSTPGAAGDSFVPVDVADGFSAVEFLYIVTDNPMVVRVSDGPALLSGFQALLPTGFVGGETMALDIDDTSVLVTFQAGDQTLTDVVNRINAECAALGLPTPRARATGINTFEVLGVATRFEPNPSLSAVLGIVESLSTPAAITSPTPPVAVANGNDIPVFGTMMVEFPAYPNAPKQVQISGVGAYRALVAGRTSP